MAKANLMARLRHRWFQIILLLTPILPYLVMPLYNLVLFQAISNRVRGFETYPNAQLIDTNFYMASGGGFDRYWNWVLQFHTTDDFHKVVDFYSSSLIKSGWSSPTHSMMTRVSTEKECNYPGGVDAEQYTFSNLILLLPLRPVEDQDVTYCVYISARFSALFDLRY